MEIDIGRRKINKRFIGSVSIVDIALESIHRNPSKYKSTNERTLRISKRLNGPSMCRICKKRRK